MALTENTKLKFWIYFKTRQSKFLQFRNNLAFIFRSFSIQKVGVIYELYLVAFPLFLLDEYKGATQTSHFRLIKFDLDKDTLQAVQSFEFDSHYFVFLDQFNSEKFILACFEEHQIQSCKLINGQIQMGEATDIEWDPNVRTVSYFDHQLYGLQIDLDEDDELTGVCIKILNIFIAYQFLF